MRRDQNNISTGGGLDREKDNHLASQSRPQPVASTPAAVLAATATLTDKQAVVTALAEITGAPLAAATIDLPAATVAAKEAAKQAVVTTPATERTALSTASRTALPIAARAATANQVVVSIPAAATAAQL
jgi:hypothetical protein